MVPQFSDAVYQESYLFSEIGYQLFSRIIGILNSVMQKPTDDSRLVHSQSGQNERHVDRVDKVRFSALSKLSVVKFPSLT